VAAKGWPFAGKTKAWGWLKFIQSVVVGWSLFLAFTLFPLKYLPGICRHLLENQKKEQTNIRSQEQIIRVSNY
jgi:hypothetical protein